LLHLRAAKEAGRTAGRLYVPSGSILRVATEVRKEAIRAVDRVGDFRRHGLVEGDRAGVALDRVVFAALAFHLLALHLFAFALVTLSVGHFLLALALALQNLAFP
jgi:hypothetical protein